MRICRRIVAISVALCGAGCAPVGTSVPMGIWGGEGVSVDVGGDGAIVQLDCAHGIIASPLDVRADGWFELRGSMTFETGGPGADDASQPVTFEGEHRGDTLAFSIRPDSGAFTPRTFVTVRGREPVIRRCL